MNLADRRHPFIPLLAVTSFAILMVIFVACGGDGGGGGDGNGGSGGGDAIAATGGGDKLQIRSPFDDYGNAVTVDTAGNVYIAGHIEDALPGQTYLGGKDAFIQKRDGSLAEVWTRQFGTDNNDSVETIAVDDVGNVYLAGSTIGEFSGHTTEYFGSDAFVRVYDADGTERWTTQFGTDFATVAQAVAVDGAGNLYVGGYTEGGLPGFENAGGAPLGPVSDWNDAFLRKYGSDGTVLWIQQFGHERHDEVLGVALDGSGSVYVSGYTDASFEGYNNPGGRDAFIRKYDPDGNVVWTRQFGSSSSAGGQPNDKALDIALDSSGNIYVSGSTTGVFEGEDSGGANDGFVRKMDANGEHLWTRQFGGEDDDTADAIAVDERGMAFIAGNTASSIPGAGGEGQDDGFAKSFDANGDDRWTRTVGTRRVDGARDVAQGSGGVYVIGGTEGEIGPGGAGKGDNIDSDVFVLRLSR
ncbi:MAG: SBBP repeat-containing protein [Chloroflexi bacterium]|nr:SBBP repeat-containing protein [Chloroflexota bacterium]